MAVHQAGARSVPHDWMQRTGDGGMYFGTESAARPQADAEPNSNNGSRVIFTMQFFNRFVGRAPALSGGTAVSWARAEEKGYSPGAMNNPSSPRLQKAMA